MVDAVSTTIEQLKALYAARTVIVVGHSGGAAIAAILLGRHPDVVDSAVLVACVCDVTTWRAQMKAERPNPIWDQPVSSLSPLDVVATVKSSTVVELVVGSDDNVAVSSLSDAYATALSRYAPQVRVSVLPGLGHNILLEPAVLETVFASVAKSQNP